MAHRPHGHAYVNASNPRAWATCDRCGRLFNHNALSWQYEWAGTQLINIGELVCSDCLDIPQEQLRTIILPPDPVNILAPRPEPYAIDEPNFRVTQNGDQRVTNSGDVRVTQDQNSYLNG